MRAPLAFVLGILLLLGSFVPENDLGELAKLPRLVEHYQYHHSAAGGGLNFGQFIAEHYGAGTRHYDARCGLSPQHRHEHHNLPLRCHHGCAVVAFVLPTTRLALPAHAPVLPTEATYGASRASGYALWPTAALLQPPRA